jgi:hypothetical protein
VGFVGFVGFAGYVDFFVLMHGDGQSGGLSAEDWGMAAHKPTIRLGSLDTDETSTAPADV